MSNIKILSAILSFLLLFAISCSNEGTTGGIVITKTEIEAMIQSIGEVLATGGITQAKFNFSGEDKTFKNTKPNFEVATSGNALPSFGTPYDISVMYNGSDETPKIIQLPSFRTPYDISTASDEIVKKLKETEKYKEYFSDCNKKHHENNENEKHNLTLYFQFTLKSGYALSSEVAHLTSEGLSIKLTLRSGENWE